MTLKPTKRRCQELKGRWRGYPTFSLKTTSEKHWLHNKNLSLSYESDDNIVVAAEPMSDDEDQ